MAPITYTPEERYSMSTFLDGVESYFGSGTRDSISRDSFVYITELVLNEQHLYGSSRLGMIQHADTFRNIYISHIVSIDSPDDEQRLFVYGVDTYYWDSLYTHQRGSKVYEGTNHLGNVLVTYTDKRLTECQEDTIYRYVADVKSQTDYSAFHALLPDRQWYSNNDSGNYRFGGSNGQEKTDELSGVGNHYTAEYWEMDPRLGRRWNVDPMAHLAPGWTPFRVMFNSPLIYGDKQGLFETRYETEEGELIRETDDGINVTVVVPNHKLEDVSKQLKPWMYENTPKDDLSAHQYTNTSFWNSMLTESILKDGGSYKAYNMSGDFIQQGVKGEVDLAAKEINWEQVGNGLATTIGGTFSTVAGSFAVLSGIGVPAGVAGITFGVPMMGFGFANILDGFSGGTQNIPGGTFEAIDIGLGSDGRYGQLGDIFSGGLPKNTASGLLMGYGIYKSKLGQEFLFGPKQIDLAPYPINHNLMPIDNTRLKMKIN